MGTPNYPRDLASEWNKLRRDIKGAFTSANVRTGMAKIGAKVIEVTGELILNPGAQFGLKYKNGNYAMRLRNAIIGGKDVQQISFYRYDTTAVMQMYSGEGEPGFFSVFDQDGNIIISNDAGSGQGLARPWLPYTFIDYDDLLLPKKMITSSTFSSVHHVAGFMQHPRVEIYGYLRADGSDVAEIRVKNPNTGTVLYTASGQTTGWKSMVFNHQDYEFGNGFSYDVEIRRTSGTSTGVGFTVTKAHGVQS